MKKILLLIFMALPLVFTSCSDDDDKSHKQSYSHRIGAVETSMLTFYYKDGNLPKGFLKPKEGANYKIDKIDVDGQEAGLRNENGNLFELIVSGRTENFSVGKTVTITVKWSDL